MNRLYFQMKIFCVLLGAVAAGFFPAVTASAQILMSGGAYSQNFDSLASSGTANGWTNNVTLPGWYASQSAGLGVVSSYRAESGSGNTGALYSFGATGSSERALGSVASGTPGNLAYGVRFTNDTALTATNITISYTGEQWRNGGNTNAQKLAFSYLVSSSPITNSDALNANSWTAFTGLDFTTPTVGATSSALDGNNPANEQVFTNVVLPVVVQPGQEIFLRWFDTNDSGNDHAVAIDNLTVSFSASTNSPPTNSPPVITTQPQSQTVNSGDSVIFSVAAAGTALLSYQWNSNSVSVAGATNNTFTLASVTTNLTGSVYFATITNVVGATNSQAATLTVNAMAPVSPPAGTNGAITLMTYNVKGNGVADWSTNTAQVQAIGRELVYLNPDIIAFNEIPYTNTWQMANWVTAFLPGYFLATNSGTDGFIRSVIASRFPINRSQSWLSHANLNPFGYTNNSSQNADNFTRDLFEAEINVPNWPLPLHVFTTHLKSDSGTTYADAAAKHAAEAAAITNFFATNFFVLSPAHPFTLSGDMNDSDTNTLAIQRLISAPTTLRLTNPINPFTGSINTYSIQGSVSERIDFICPSALLVSNIIGGQVFRTDLLTNFPANLFSNDDKIASDHLPVLMTFANPFDTPFKLLSIAQTNQNVTLKWESQNNRNYNIEASSNLVAWTLFATNLATTTTNATYAFTSNNVPDRIKFFRIYRVP